jgi:hypothetical protein
MKEQFASYEISLKLKELGFNEPCAGWIGADGYMSVFIRDVRNSDTHGENCAVPLWQQVEAWFREKHNLSVFVSNSYHFPNYGFDIDGDTTMSPCGCIFTSESIPSYGQAREQAILKCIELCQKK